MSWPNACRPANSSCSSPRWCSPTGPAGTVVGSLRNLTKTLEERKETRREVRTQLSQVVVTAYVVPLLGIGTLLLMNRIAPGAIDRMTSSFLGQLAVVVAFALYGLGFFFIRRLSKIDV